MPHCLSPCVGIGQVPTPVGVPTQSNTDVAVQTENQAGVTGNACCLVVQRGSLCATISYGI